MHFQKTAIVHDGIEAQLTLCTRYLGGSIARVLIMQEDTLDANIVLLKYPTLLVWLIWQEGVRPSEG